MYLKFGIDMIILQLKIATNGQPHTNFSENTGKMNPSNGFEMLFVKEQYRKNIFVSHNTQIVDT